MSANDTHIDLKIHTGSIPRGLDESGSEYRRLYEAIDDAAAHGATVTITRYGQTFRLVPEQQGCVPCQAGRHEDCALVWASNPEHDSCGCDQRTLHQSLRDARARDLAERVALYRMSRR